MTIAVNRSSDGDHCIAIGLRHTGRRLGRRDRSFLMLVNHANNTRCEVHCDNQKAQKEENGAHAQSHELQTFHQ